MENNNRVNLIHNYISDISKANTETAKKERLILLLKSLFPNTTEAELINDFTLGAETSVANILRASGRGRGQVDTQYRSVIIEFEKDLLRTGEHAKYQLCEYLTGNWNSNIKIEFTIIASDCLRWNIYAPDYLSLIKLSETQKLKPLDVKLELLESLVLVKQTDDNKAEAQADNFYYFLDRHLFRQEQIPATFDDVRKCFGHTSSVYTAALKCLYSLYIKIKNNNDIKIAYNEWHKFLYIAYGKMQFSEHIFLTHSYLSILAKIFAILAIEHKVNYNTHDIILILNGEAFKKYNINNFCDDDFFRWIVDKKYFEHLIPMIHIIYNQILLFNFSSINDDILKGIYQELIDEDTRHGLGEFYTPDWLCSKIIKTLDIKKGEKILDPACGSGSFLKAAANELCHHYNNITAEELNECLYGIDIHPLSVQITKATILMSFGSRLLEQKSPINLHIYLANTLLLPNDTYNIFENFVILNIDNNEIKIPLMIFEDSGKYDFFIQSINKFTSNDVKNQKKMSKFDLDNFYINLFKCKDKNFLDAIFNLYNILYDSKNNDRNGIWAYILQNSYRPFLLREKFDVIIGNPPWITYSNIENNEYQKNIQNLAKGYKMLPKPKNMPHLEISAIFLAHSINYFLNNRGRLAMVMPRALFSGSQHESTRVGNTKSLKIEHLWDLEKIKPLFKVPTCVIIAKKNIDIPKKNLEIPGKILKGNLNKQNISFNEAKLLIVEENGKFFLSNIGNNTAWTFNSLITKEGTTYYKNKFFQGATIVPRVFYFVDIIQNYTGTLKNRILTFQTSDMALKEAKLPWKFKITNRASTNFLFTTALSSNVLPFAIIGDRKILLPLKLINNKAELCTIEMFDTPEDIYTVDWFRRVEQLWEKYKTENSSKLSFLGRLNYHNELLKQNFSSKYCVLYNTSGKNICSAILKKNDFSEFPFIIDSNLYYYDTNDENEAFYLACFLNAPSINKKIKPFQSKGLYGERHIHKKILDIPLPKYDENDIRHLKLAEIGKKISDKIIKYIDTIDLKKNTNLNSVQLGKLRNEFRVLIFKELSEVDLILNKILRDDI
jgi:type I restriction-modification system DNA methylase subunit